MFYLSEMKRVNSNVYQNRNGHQHLVRIVIKIISKFGKPNFKVFMMLIMLLMVSHMVSILASKGMKNSLMNICQEQKNSIFNFQQNKPALSPIGYLGGTMKDTFPAHLTMTFHFHSGYIHRHYL